MDAENRWRIKHTDTKDKNQRWQRAYCEIISLTWRGGCLATSKEVYFVSLEKLLRSNFGLIVLYRDQGHRSYFTHKNKKKNLEFKN